MKKYLSVLLSIAMLSPLATLPISASAAEVEVQSVSVADKAIVVPDSTIEKAYDDVKQNILNHESSFTVKIPFRVNDFSVVDDYFSDLQMSLLDKAFEHDGNPIGGDYITNQVSSRGYTYDWSTVNDKGTANITYTISYFTTKKQEKELDKKVDEILDSLDLDGKSDYDKVRNIYDYLTSNIVYDDEAVGKDDKIPYSAYAALCKGKAVCQGYSTALYRLLLEEGIDCRVIKGRGLNEYHAWNVIKLGDVYYNADATWDAPRRPYEYFLLCDADFKDHATDKKSLPNYVHAKESFKINTDDKSPAGSGTGSDILMIGDIDGDNKLTSADSLNVLRASVGIDKLDSITFKLANVNGDSKVDSLDALEILRFSIGLPSSADLIGTYLK